PVGEGDDLVGGPAAGGEPGQGGRGPHDLEELAPAGRRERLVEEGGELLLRPGLELRRVRQVLQAPPVARRRGQRWHVLQSVGGWMAFSARRRAPRARRSP